jgi:hypothetical protein
MGYMDQTTPKLAPPANYINNDALAELLEWMAQDCLREERPTEAVILREAASRLAK